MMGGGSRVTKTDSPKKSVLERIPLRPELLWTVVSAAAVLMFAEFVRSGFYMGFLARTNEHFHLSDFAVGAAWSAHLYTDTLMRGPAGAALQRFGPRRVVMAGMALCLAAMSLLLVTQSNWMIFLIAILHGIGFSPMWPATINMTADAAKEGYQWRVLSLVSTSIMPMTGAGLFAFGVLATRVSPTYVVLLALAVLGSGLVLSLLLPNHRPAHITEAQKEKVSRSVWRALLPLLPAALMQTLTQSLIGSWIMKLAPRLGLSDLDLIGLLVVGGALAFGAMPFAGKVADRGRARFAVALGYALVGLAFVGFATLPPVWALFVLAPIAGLGYAFLTPGWAALITQMLPEAQRPSAWGVLMTVESAGFAAGPLLGGIALAHGGAADGPRWLFGTGALLALLTALGYTVFRKAFEPDPFEPDSFEPNPEATPGEAR